MGLGPREVGRRRHPHPCPSPIKGEGSRLGLGGRGKPPRRRESRPRRYKPRHPGACPRDPGFSRPALDHSCTDRAAEGWVPGTGPGMTEAYGALKAKPPPLGGSRP